MRTAGNADLDEQPPPPDSAILDRRMEAADNGLEEALAECPICGEPRLEPRFKIAFPDFGPELAHVWPLDVEPPVGYWTIFRCTGCGVQFPNPFPRRDVIAGFYARQSLPSDWEEVHYVAETPDRVRGWTRTAEKLTRLTGAPGRMLEVGPAAGHLMKAMQQLGWSVVGIEATPKFTNILRDHGLETHLGTLESYEGGEAFDLIAMFDVFEHLHDPIGDLSRCHRLLKPDGHLVIATCDIESFAARYYGLRWRQLVISHTFYWTRRSIATALAQAGLGVVQFSSVRWWDPDQRRERREWFRELAKLVVRKAVHAAWLPLVTRSSALTAFQRRHPRFDHWVDFKIGDQAVMSEVLLAVASPLDSAT